jgi:hypothetical protein
MHLRITSPCHTPPRSQGSGPARNGPGRDGPTGYHASRTRNTFLTSMTSSPSHPPKNVSSSNGNRTGCPSLIPTTTTTILSSQTHPMLNSTPVHWERSQLGPAKSNVRSSNLLPSTASLPTTPPNSDHQPVIGQIACDVENFTQHTTSSTTATAMS